MSLQTSTPDVLLSEIRGFIEDARRVLRDAGILHEIQNLLPGLPAEYAQITDQAFQLSAEQVFSVQIGQHRHQ